ncbi:MAG TPA: cation diffusion facilitator family transporter [Gemmatimonadales bacterium]
MADGLVLPFAAQCTHRAPGRGESARRLTWVLGLTALVMCAEAAGGLVAHSLALLADAGHMLADVGAIGLALFAARMARLPATPERTFGYLRMEILAALANGAVLFAIVVAIAFEAMSRLRHPTHVNAPVLLAIAAVGFAANVVAARILHHGHDHSLNQRAAFLHVVGDLLGSLAALVAGGVILATGWTPPDPILSLAISLLVLVSAWRLVRESVDVLLEAAPAHIPLAAVHERLASVPGVSSVHDLHVWTVTSGVVAMSGHLVVRDPGDHQRVLEQVQDRMGAFGIGHVTVQVEREQVCD